MTLTLPEAARKMNRDPETLRRWIRGGRLRARKVGTQYLIEEAELPLPARSTVPLPGWLRRTAAGTPMPDVVAMIRRQRRGH
ncbi:MAG: helix-turn-helix domain-containing protein [Terriglobales bacterium]